MQLKPSRPALLAAMLAAPLASTVGVPALAQTMPAAAPASAPSTEAPAAPSGLEQSLRKRGNWYFSWGYSRQQYAPSDIHVSQPTLGNDFTVHQATATDYPTSFEDTVNDLFSLNLTSPQENLRVGKYLNPEQTFAVELSVDHSKYNTDLNQTALVTGNLNGPVNSNQVLTRQYFSYALHNGLNHIMVNAVWLNHLLGPSKQPGDLQLISRVGAGILLPHAENTIAGQDNQVGPKNQNICCFNSNDWWQVNGWTAGVEVGLRYTIYKSVYLELTSKIAYGALHGVPVYQGSADQNILMTEQVLSTGFHF